MLKTLTLLVGMTCAAEASTITYEIDADAGIFIDGVYGDREAIRALYDEELRNNQDEFEFCQSSGYGGCDTALQFEDYRVRGIIYPNGSPIEFEDYYNIHMDEARAAGAINTWRNGGLTIVAPSYGGFYPRGPDSFLEFGYVLDGGDSDGPSNLRLSIPEDEIFVSIDLRVTSWSVGSIDENLINTSFDGTFFFDDTFYNKSMISLAAGPLDPFGSFDVGYMFFDNLITTLRNPNPHPATPVPLSPSSVMLGIGLLSFGGLLRTRRRRTATLV